MPSDVPGHLANTHGSADRPVEAGAARVIVRTSIASLTAVSVAFLSTLLVSHSHAQASTDVNMDGNSALVLPPLANTPETDRLMLREIGDQHIFDLNSLTVGRVRERAPRDSAEQLLTQLEQLPEPEATTVWQFVGQSRRLQIPDNEAIVRFREQYEREALWISKILHRATPFAGHIVDELDKRFMPVELALLPAIESGFQPDVHSAENAAGMWQIVPTTAREIGIERNLWFDGRSDIIESTVAAVDYLSYLNAEFHGDWLLTLAAYNGGLGRVRSAIKRNQKKELPTDFWSLRLPAETRDYVPKFLALVDMLRAGETLSFEIPVVDRGDGFDIVDLGQRVSLDWIARTSGLPQGTLRNLNAGLVHGVTPPDGPHYIYVPRGLGDELAARLDGADAQGTYTLPATHTVVAGDSISSIARQYGLTQSQLRKLNALEGTVIKIGQLLAVRGPADESQERIEYVVTIGDTLSDIAQRFSVRLSQIRDQDGQLLANDIIHPGERLSIVFFSNSG